MEKLVEKDNEVKAVGLPDMVQNIDGKMYLFGKEITVDDNAIDPELEIKENNRIENFKNCVPKMFWNSSLDNFIAETKNEKEALQETKKLIKRTKDGDCNELLLFYGKCGTGKTHLGASMVRELGGVYINSFNLCIEYECCTDFKAKQNRVQMLKKYTHEKFLVIDEVGRGKDNVENEILPYIINSRYEELLPTVLITNLDKDFLLRHKLGVATTDRLCEVCISVCFDGKSKRLGLRHIDNI